MASSVSFWTNTLLECAKICFAWLNWIHTNQPGERDAGHAPINTRRGFGLTLPECTGLLGLGPVRPRLRSRRGNAKVLRSDPSGTGCASVFGAGRGGAGSNRTSEPGAAGTGYSWPDTVTVSFAETLRYSLLQPSGRLGMKTVCMAGLTLRRVGAHRWQGRGPGRCRSRRP